MNRRFLIIGSNSFSGSNLINHLLKNKKNKIIGFSRSKELSSLYLNYKKSKNIKNFKFYKINLSETNKMVNIINSYKPNYLINYAAQGMVNESWIKPQDWYLTNIVFQSQLYQELINKKFLKKIVHFSTPEVYGSTSLKIKENFNFNPSTPYAISRAATDLHLKRLQENYGLPIIFTRAANVYGSCQQLYRIIPKTIISFKSKKKIEIHGNGKSIRSFIHINDVNIAIEKILKKGKVGQTYHISNVEKISIYSLIKQIAKIMNVDLKKNIKFVDDRKGKDKIYDLSSLKLKRQLLWKPKINLSEGLNETISWIDKNIKLLNKESLNYKHKK
jgi:dTDP-glucose 4,6-dehydratase